jgi:hypothetical protein
MGKDMVVCRKKKIMNAVDTEGRMNPTVVSKSLNVLNNLNRGIMIDAKGTIMDRSSMVINRSFALLRYITKP